MPFRWKKEPIMKAQLMVKRTVNFQGIITIARRNIVNTLKMVIRDLCTWGTLTHAVIVGDLVRTNSTTSELENPSSIITQH